MSTNQQVSNAVQNTLKPTEVTVTEDQLAPDLKKKACKAIDEAYDIQWRKGGVEDTKKILEGLQGKIGEKVYTVAKLACEQAKNNFPIARAMFLALCAVAEKHIKNTHTEAKGEEVSVGKLIPQWSAYKADIAKGLERGIDPQSRGEGGSLKYATAAQYREASRTGNGGSTGSQAGQQRANTNGSVVLQLVERGWNATLSAAMQVLSEKLNALSVDEQAAWAPRVLALAGEVDQRLTELKASKDQNASVVEQVAKEMGAQDIDADTRAAMQAAIDSAKTPEEGKTVATELLRAKRGKDQAKRGGSRAA
jgi:hypothetical protein